MNMALWTYSYEHLNKPIAVSYKAAAWLKAWEYLHDIYSVESNPDYHSNIKTTLEVAITANLFNGASISSNIPETFQQGWDAVHNVPENICSMTKEQFYDDLATRFPGEFTFDGNGDLIEPAYLVSPPSSPDFTPLYAALEPPPVPAAVTAAKTPFNAAFSESSSLVLDLTTSHTGIALTTFNAATTTTFFDIDNSGFATQTAWVGANQGLLCRDLNGNGRIDNAGELFSIWFRWRAAQKRGQARPATGYTGGPCHGPKGAGPCSRRRDAALTVNSRSRWKRTSCKTRRAMTRFRAVERRAGFLVFPGGRLRMPVREDIRAPIAARVKPGLIHACGGRILSAAGHRAPCDRALIPHAMLLAGRLVGFRLTFPQFGDVTAPELGPRA